MKVYRLVVQAIMLGLASLSITSIAWAQAVDNSNQLNHNYWNDWYFGWGWILWFGFIVLIFSCFGSWSYSYRAHRKYEEWPRKQAFDILNERYARGEITREQYGQMRSDIANAKS